MFRRFGLKFSSYYSLETSIEKLINEHRIDFDNILVEYCDSAYGLHSNLKKWLSRGKHVIIHLHGYDAVADNFPDDYVPKLRELAEMGAIFVSNSRFTASIIEGWQLPDTQLVIKPYGVDIPDDVRQHHDGHKVRILHLGRLVDFKAPHLTIKAFEIACEQGLDGELIVAGDGRMRSLCESLWHESQWKDHIQLLGAVDWETAHDLRLEADIFTLHSIVGEESGRVENLGVAVLEAMAVELPVVTCAMGGIKETVVSDKTGIFFPSNDVQAQAQAFLRLARDPELRRNLGKAGRLHVIGNFSSEREKADLQKLLLQ